MSHVTVGQWGKNLAIRFPFNFAEAICLSEGERVEIERQGMDILIRRPTAQSQAEALAAAEEIMSESQNYRLGNITIRALIEEGRRG